MLTSRFVKFTKSLLTSSKPSIRYLASITRNDNRTLMGKTLSKISRDLLVDRTDLTSSLVSRKMVYAPVPADQMWRLDTLLELLKVRDNTLKLDDFQLDEIKTIIDYLCIS